MDIAITVNHKSESIKAKYFEIWIRTREGGSEIMYLLTLFYSKFNSAFSLISVSVPITFLWNMTIFFTVKSSIEVVSYLHLFGAKFFIMSTNFF